MPHQPPEPRAGDVLDDRFRLLQQIQTDRAGRVFDALDEDTGEVVRLRTTVGPVDPRRLGIQHPGLAHPTGVATHDRYVVLRDLDDEPMVPCPTTSVSRLRTLADATLPTLADLHDHGIVHGELQPSSFWQDRAGTVRLVDLGLSVALGRARTDLPFVSPERAFGRAADDPRMDVFAVAAVLFHLATGLEPCPEALERSGLPTPVRRVLALAMEPRPAYRPKNAGALHRALSEALDRSEPPAPQPTTVPMELDAALEADTLNPAPSRAEPELEPLPWWAGLMLLGGLSLLLGTVLLLAAIALGSATLL